MSGPKNLAPSLSREANGHDSMELEWELTKLPLDVQRRLASLERAVAGAAGIAKLLRADALLEDVERDAKEGYEPFSPLLRDQLQMALYELCSRAWDDLSHMKCYSGIAPDRSKT